jgi:CRP-like cAMP-binding protein
MIKNVLLNQLSDADFRLLEPHLKAVHFEQHAVLFEADQNIRQTYFPTSAVISLVVTLRGTPC